MSLSVGRPVTRDTVRHQRTFGFMLCDVSRRYVRRFEQHAGTLSLTLPQCRTLVLLESNQGLSQARLARLVNAEPMAMVRILDRMESDGLLERRADPADRRARRLYLTRKARPLLRRIWRLADLTRGELFRGVAARDRRHFISVLDKLHANVDAMQGLDGEPVPDAPRPRARPRTGQRRRA